MPQSLARVVLHVVFSTKNRVPFLRETEVRARLYAYMAGVLQHIGCEPILINGVETMYTSSAIFRAKSPSRAWSRRRRSPHRNG